MNSSFIYLPPNLTPEARECLSALPCDAFSAVTQVASWGEMTAFGNNQALQRPCKYLQLESEALSPLPVKLVKTLQSRPRALALLALPGAGRPGQGCGRQRGADDLLWSQRKPGQS